jgi:membrane protease YdiL (CAAX protease family)
VFWAAGFGLVAADLTARTGNLGAAVALHFTNNISAILMVGLAGNLGGLTLYQVHVPSDDIGKTLLYLALDCAGLMVAWMMARLILRR